MDLIGMIGYAGILAGALGAYFYFSEYRYMVAYLYKIDKMKSYRYWKQDEIKSRDNERNNKRNY